jgi:hypothetical protein
MIFKMTKKVKISGVDGKNIEKENGSNCYIFFQHARAAYVNLVIIVRLPCRGQSNRFI